MRRHPWAIFMVIAVLLTLGSAIDDPVPTRTATENRQPQQPPPAPPADRRLTNDTTGGNVAHAAERRAAERRTAERRAGRDTFAAVNGFLLNALWVAVAVFIAWVLWEALLGPVRWRQRRN